MRIYQQNETGDIYQIVQGVLQLDMLAKQLSPIFLHQRA